MAVNKPHVWLLRQTVASGEKIIVRVSITTAGGLHPDPTTGKLMNDPYPPSGAAEGSTYDKHLKFDLISGGVSGTFTDEFTFTIPTSTANDESAGVIVRVKVPGDSSKPVRGKVKATYACADTDASGGGGV